MLWIFTVIQQLCNLLPRENFREILILLQPGHLQIIHSPIQRNPEKEPDCSLISVDAALAQTALHEMQRIGPYILLVQLFNWFPAEIQKFSYCPPVNVLRMLRIGSKPHILIQLFQIIIRAHLFQLPVTFWRYTHRFSSVQESWSVCKTPASAGSFNVANASCQNAEEVFRWLEEFNDQYCFAINIKADGMKEMLTESLKRHRIKNYFTFDMSVPQMVEFQQQGLVYFTRQSEIEPVPVMYETAAGVWIDGFWSSDWITQKLLEKHIVYGKTVCIVSPDLHGRPYLDFWARLYKLEINFDKVMLCTDYPFEACEFFRG